MVSWSFDAVNRANWGKFIWKNVIIYNIILFCRNRTKIEIEWKEMLCLLTKFRIHPQGNRFLLGFSMHVVDEIYIFFLCSTLPTSNIHKYLRFTDGLIGQIKQAYLLSSFFTELSNDKMIQILVLLLWTQQWWGWGREYHIETSVLFFILVKTTDYVMNKNTLRTSHLTVMSY